MLPKLAKEFDISIQELLDGEIIPKETLDNHEDRSLEYVCIYAGQQQKKQSKKIMILIVLSVILFVAVLAVSVLPYFVGFYYSVIGSDSCIVAEDYSSLTFRGNKYVPLPLNGYECPVGERILDEVQVEGSGFIGKLFFGDSLYEVKGVMENELVFLQTDYDCNVSDYYVLETEYDKYYQMFCEGSYDHYYAARWLDNGYTLEVQMSDDVLAAITDPMNMTAVDESVIDEQRDSIRVYAYDDSHLFYRWMGDLIRIEDKYYWTPSVYSDDYFGTYYMSHRYYAVSDGFSEELDEYFLNLCG